MCDDTSVCLCVTCAALQRIEIESMTLLPDTVPFQKRYEASLY